jgi:hypothetical protein
MESDCLFQQNDHDSLHILHTRFAITHRKECQQS